MIYSKQLDSKTSCIIVNSKLSKVMANIVFEKSGVTAPWTGDEESILELGEIHDLDLDYGCRMGNCTACQQPILSGEVDYPNGHTGEPDEGNALLCCCQPKGDADLVIGA
jgi:ferredoxin